MSAQREDWGRISEAAKRRGLLGLKLLICVGVIVLMLLFCHSRLQSERNAILKREWISQEERLNSGIASIASWRDEIIAHLTLLCASDMLRLLLHDEANMAQNAQGSHQETQEGENYGERSANLVYVQAQLQDLAGRLKWEKAFIARPDGSIMVGDGRQLDNEQRTLALESVQKRQILFGTVKKSVNGLVMDIAAPVSQTGVGGVPKIRAVAVASVLMDDSLKLFLRPPDITSNVAQAVIFQYSNGSGALITANSEGAEISPIQASFEYKYLPFGLRQSLTGTNKVYSQGMTIFSLPWTLILQSPESVFNASLEDKKILIYGQGILLISVIVGFFFLIWMRYLRYINTAGNINLENLISTVQRQKLLLDSLNSTIHFGLALIDQEGRIQSCNESFCRICGRENILPGSSVREFLPDEAGKNLVSGMNISKDISCLDSPAKQGAQVRNTDIEIVLPAFPGAGGMEHEELYMGGCLYRVTLFPCPSQDQHDNLADGGCVAIFQDITEHRNASRKQKKRQEAMVSALSRAIESVDENLLGHSDRMAALARKLSGHLDLQPDEMEALELACHLSQIGRLFVPRELFIKTTPLSCEEREMLHRMPVYASKFLNNLDFGLPVSKIIGEMGERMDGTGFPSGLIGIQISRCARILAALNAYVAMTSARKWRAGGKMSRETALDMLASDYGFDRQVVEALRLVNS